MDKGKREFILVMRDNISFFYSAGGKDGGWNDDAASLHLSQEQAACNPHIQHFFPHTFFLSKCCIRGKNQSNHKEVHILSTPVTLNSLHGDLFVLDYSHMVKLYIDISYSSKQNLFTYRVHIKKDL